MNNEHPVTDEVLDMASIALSKGKQWMAYNQSMYSRFDSIPDIIKKIFMRRKYQSNWRETSIL